MTSNDVPDWWATAADNHVLPMPDGWEDMVLPMELVKQLPTDLRNAVIRYGDVHKPTDSVRLNGPPGTGKTTQIALRLAVLILEHGIDPEEMTVVTFRKDLAGAVKLRLRKWGVLDEDDDLRYWTTMHAAANRATGLLERDPFEDTSGRLGPAVDVREKACYCKDRGIPFWPPKTREWETTRGQLLFALFDYLANNLIDPHDEQAVRQAPGYDELREQWPSIDVAAEWDRYEEFKDQRDWYDFHELLDAALGTSLPPTRVVVVDEYHDCTPLMAAVAEHWYEHADICVAAGDPLQVVNAYSGASPRFFTDRLDYPEILLDVTYRVGEEHWQAATRELQREFTAPPVERTGRSEIIPYVSPTFSPPSGHGDSWDIPQPDQKASPAKVVRMFIDGRSDRTALFLTRTRRWARGVSAALDEAGIIHGGQRGPGGWGWSDHRLDMFNVIKKLERVPSNYGHTGHGYGLDEYTGDAGDVANLKFRPGEFAEILDHANARTLAVKRDEAEDIARKVRREEEQKDLDDLDELVEPAFWEQYTAGAASVRKLTKDDLSDADLLALERALPQYDSTVRSTRDIRVLTIHASKGSEASDIAVYDGITSKIAREMERDQETKDNEARTWYVALSRASERLHIMYDAFPSAIDRLPRNLAQNAAATAQRRSTAVTDGGDRQ